MFEEHKNLLLTVLAYKYNIKNEIVDMEGGKK